MDPYSLTSPFRPSSARTISMESLCTSSPTNVIECFMTCLLGCGSVFENWVPKYNPRCKGQVSFFQLSAIMSYYIWEKAETPLGRQSERVSTAHCKPLT